ncbi:Rieske 2Fe-2S domain-containing protein [Oculatella sp. FACHB-28]|uniref:Rieske 2Fe-2S domain-containing protein n=1 Tax=Oculatella sp. FACHB-28 TaxID=2692845 RepID=UPI001681D511|nr:Rieske 2Fe-2S domain-containing protein [Oculatella sp. FACHB-28]MBD2060638.1 Rieske 2Fe-2S domain-containing protein [Oculatella sp. FACHB-28]
MNPTLPGAPWMIAHRSMLGINKPYKLTLNGQDYVLWQNRGGEIFALENVCPHMQAPLSDGWICEANNTITCPYHALEFDGAGRLLKDGAAKGEPLADKLDLVVQDDLIWTYGGHEPRLPIPDLISTQIKGFRFLGVAGNKSIQAEFLRCIKINYDFNHQNGVHRELFRIQANLVELFEQKGVAARVVQTFLRTENTVNEILQNPSLLTLPKQIKNELEYSFPSTTIFKAQLPLGKVLQVFILYPEAEQRTRTFVLFYGNLQSPLFLIPGVKAVLERSLLDSTAKVVEQDVRAVADLYPAQKPKIRLPKEEILLYVEQLYRNW